MIAIIWVVLTIVFGFSIVRLLPLHLRRLEAAAFSVTIGFAAAAWVVFLLALLAGWNIGLILGTILMSGFSGFVHYRAKKRIKIVTEPYSKKYRALATILALATVFVVSQLVVKSYQFPSSSGAWLSNGNVWGDGPLHVAIANQFAHGNKVDLVSPSYMKVPMTYPFLPDLYSGVLRRLGGSWTIAMMVPSLLMMLALLQMIYSFGYRVLGSTRAAWLQFLFIVYSGSLRGGWRLSKVLFTKGLAAYHTTVGNSVAFATGDNYLNFIHSHPLPQRSYLFGMPLLIAAFWAALDLTTNIHGAKVIAPKALLKKQTYKLENIKAWFSAPAIVVGLMIGMMPLIHVHSFFIISGLFALAIAYLLIREKAFPLSWLGMLIVAAVTVPPQLIWQFVTTYDSHFHQWIHGWKMENFATTNQNWFVFWFGAIGFVFVMMLIGWRWLKKQQAPSVVWLFYIAGMLIFAACNVYVFQPNMWDNMKFFEYGFWFEMMAAAYVLANWSRQKRSWIYIAPIIVSMVAMGFYTLVLSGPRLTFELLSKDEVAFGKTIDETLPKDAFILVGDRHNHPVTMLGARKVVMTFAGWYNLYDSNWVTVWQDRDHMLKGLDGTEKLINDYHITDVVLSQDDINAGNANLDFYQQHYSLLFKQANFYVFDTNVVKNQ